MCLFLQIKYLSLKNLHYIKEILLCYKKYSKYLHDDFMTNDGIEYVMYSIPYLWVICDINKNFMGFASLDNFVGNASSNFSAEITTCFHRRAWGIFTKYSAKLFLKKCFDEFGLYKIKAQIFPDNFRVISLLKSAGFEYETTLPSDTLRNGKLQDIDIYSIKRSYYYKNEENYYD
jgi:RimJ/RimL family protein N-acetyltransferase